MPHSKNRALVLLVFWGLLAGNGLLATSSDVSRSKAVEVRVLLGQESAAPGAPVMLGLHIRMKAGWHTYWQNPGDSGQATTWSVLGAGVTSVAPIQWPLPERLPAGPLMSYGYRTETVLLRGLTVPESARPGTVLSLTNAVSWLECADVCIPGKATLRLNIPIEPVGRPHVEHQQFLMKVAKRLPRPLPRIWTWESEFSAGATSLLLRGAGHQKALYFFPDPGVRLAYAEPQTFLREGNDLRVLLKSDPAAPPSAQLSGVIVFQTGDGPVGYAVGGSGPLQGGLDLWGALFFAFVGGLILNLMPCVLPVLSIKVQGLLSRSGESRARSLLHGGAMTAGVLGSFWLMAGAILLARAGGESLGWGFQLQSPGIVLVLGGIMLLFALNLMGVFELGASLQRAGSHAGGSGLLGSLLTGVLAVVVAAPCTAPFMGAAIGFAVVQPAAVALGVFTALGLGLAFPYILLSAFPNLLAFLPKQGAWMDTLKKSMGFFLAAAVAWLVWLLGKLSGVDAVGLFLGCLLVLASAAWLYGHLVQNLALARATRRVGAIIALVLAAAGLYLGYLAAQVEGGPQGSRSLSRGPIHWEAFSPSRLAALRHQERAVFLDFTADWCLSCKVNERTSLETEAVAAKFKTLGITALRADWTRHDPAITAVIQSHGRSGVPLYVVYPRRRGRPPFLLPELLTESIVIAALERAARD